MPADELLKLPEVLRTIAMSRAAFYRLRARGQAPRLHRLPNGQLRVRCSDLDAWLERLPTAPPELLINYAAGGAGGHSNNRSSP